MPAQPYDSPFTPDGTASPPPPPVRDDPVAGLIGSGVGFTDGDSYQEFAVEVPQPAGPDADAVRKAVEEQLAEEEQQRTTTARSARPEPIQRRARPPAPTPAATARQAVGRLTGQYPQQVRAQAEPARQTGEHGAARRSSGCVAPVVAMVIVVLVIVFGMLADWIDTVFH